MKSTMWGDSSHSLWMSSAGLMSAIDTPASVSLGQSPIPVKKCWECKSNGSKGAFCREDTNDISGGVEGAFPVTMSVSTRGLRALLQLDWSCDDGGDSWKWCVVPGGMGATGIPKPMDCDCGIGLNIIGRWLSFKNLCIAGWLQ